MSDAINLVSRPDWTPAMSPEERPSGPMHYRALLGNRVICRSRDPFLSAARVLLAEGVDPSTPLTMTNEGDAYVSLTSTVGKAAGLRVDESKGVWFGKLAPLPLDRLRNNAAG